MKKYILLVMLLCLIFVAGCIDSKRNELIEEFNKHVDTYNEDTKTMNAIMGKYNLKTIAINERITILNEYINFYNLRVNHFNSFYNFVVENEQELKNNGVDTYEWKKMIQDSIAILNNNINGMKSDVEYALQMQTLGYQQEQEYYALLKLLTSLIL